MKLMKHIMVALVLCAIPAAAVGQITSSCTACTHVAPVYMGAGGFIATATEDTEKVSWLGICGGVHLSGELTVNDDGMVSALWSADNGLACMAEAGGSFEVGPVMDGGWFWITDEKNSAVGNLISKDVLGNDAVKLTSAGAGVTMTAGKGAVYLKEKATGRVGILPNILPEKPAAPIRKCGYTGSGTTGKRLMDGCVLGDGGTVAIGWTASDWRDESTVIRRIPNGSTVVRPVDDNLLVVNVNLWGNGSGHFTTIGDGVKVIDHVVQQGIAVTKLRATGGRSSGFDTNPQFGYPGLGHQALFGKSPGASRSYAFPVPDVDAFAGSRLPPEGVSILEATDSGGLGMAGRLRIGRTARANAVASIGGVTLNHNSSQGFTGIVIAKDEAYCSTSNNHSLLVRVEFWMNDLYRMMTVPRIAQLVADNPPRNNKVVGRYDLKIVCPSDAASAHQGQELVPENLFPVQ